ncbi:SusC/RagA family TonB-linked outer membrane protein [Phocaeicola massiliensis]|uniref:SusC/RagA family TonB-linked outer membrane protein n=1 Tax=Phocaeicola massiliensis B84634 = Timone 84634 = DSM 17679 = JCM 13223 TaxID=1121098 RepID=U6RED0_9BACT|nr:TonB-dependent receptor [Phocaeicola massiliensis]EOA54096.1 SusC/RagA family TonB-linked outer membrane protein [Phocaeicola massiliensis B84634 = Timone 84634 = DSM 17679 = JCM 13223]MDQ7675694.1 putative outer membrane protein [Phocaeicola massiliensis]
MLKRIKSVSTLLFLMGVSTGTAYAVAESGITDVKITQQNGSCTGIVKDTTGETVIGASVVVKGTTNGTITGIDGDFSLNNVKQGDIIQISFVGYKTVEVKWNGQPLNVTLKDDTEMLGEVVVTGYGGQQLRTKVTNSISKVKQESLNVGMHSNPAQALSGAVAGLKVIQSSGSPGATPTIILRGGTNLDGTGSPLVVVDGQLRDSMSDINPEDIESMDVLKDAGATALYGARASNGVILITTKRGKAGFREINFKAKLGLSYARTPYEFLEAGEYIKAMRKAHWDAGHLFQDKDGNTKTYWGNWESYLNGKQPFGTGNNLDQDIYSTQFLNEDNKYLLGRGWQTVTDPITGKEILYKNTDVDKYNLNDPAFSQDYNINMSGGNDRGTYYAGLGYNRQEGVPVNTFYERYSFITNASYKIADWLTSTSSLNYNRANWKNMPGSNGSELNYFGRVRSLPPTVLFEDEEGNMKLGPGTADGNQMYQPDQWWNDNQSDKFTMSQSFKIDILKNLSLTANMNWYYSETYQESFTKDYENTPGNFVRTRSATAYYNRDFRQTYNAVLNYNETFFLDHHVEVMLGMEYYNKYQRGFEAQGQGAPTDDLPDLSLTDKGEGKRTINSWHEKQRILSFFGRLNYDFKDKYLLSFVFRRDGYSSLLGDNRWGFFPGVSAGWIFGREDFIKEAIPVMSFGKLRASYGINGNASGIGAYTLQGSYGSSNSNGSFNYNGNTSYLITELPNPNLRWEKTATFEVGADLSFFANRLNTNLTYYNRLTSDKYAALSFPTSTGFSSVTNNNGEFRNQGIEIELSGKIIDSKDWTWSASGNIAFNKNKIVSLPDNGMERNRINAFQVYTGNGDEKKWVGGQQEGQEPGILYLYQADGIYRSYDEIPANLVRKYGSRTYYGPEAWNKLTAEQQNATTNFPIQPGDTKFHDVNGDDVIDEFDKVKVGATSPRWTGGFNTTLRWKNFQLYGRFDYALGFWLYENSGTQSTTPWFMGCYQGTYNTPTMYYDTWSESNPNAKYPRYLFADQNGKNNYIASTMFAYRGDYLAIREISLSYSLPESVAKMLKMQRAEVSITGQNLGYITGAKNVGSPEANPKDNGAVGQGYSLPRTILFGVNLTF